MRLAVTGATGRMGRAVLAAAGERDDAEVVGAVSRSAGESRASGRGGDAAAAIGTVPVDPAADLPALLADREPDALVDFTAPESSVRYVEAAAEAGVASVVGTTGFADEGVARLREAAGTVPVLRATNFARGVQALLSAVRTAVAALPDHDVAVTETHHAGKRDAPSGTALTLLDAVEDVRGPAERVHGRVGEHPREEGEVGVHARRAGGVTGEHEVLLAGDREEVRLVHRAGSRRAFAAGALDAAAWLVDREPGWYGFGDVVGRSSGRGDRA